MTRFGSSASELRRGFLFHLGVFLVLHLEFTESPGLRTGKEGGAPGR